MTRIIALALTLSIAMIAATGCDSTSSTYIDGYNAAAKKLDTSGTSFTNAQNVADLDKARAQLDEAIAAFDALTPPDSVKKDHEQMVAEMQKASKTLTKVTKNSTPAQDNAATTAALKHIDAASKASERIRKELNG